MTCDSHLFSSVHIAFKLSFTVSTKRFHNTVRDYILTSDSPENIGTEGLIL